MLQRKFKKGYGLFAYETRELLAMSPLQRVQVLKFRHLREFRKALAVAKYPQAPNDRLTSEENELSHSAIPASEELDDGYWWLEGSWIIGRSIATRMLIPTELISWLDFWTRNIVSPENLLEVKNFPEWLFNSINEVPQLRNNIRLAAYGWSCAVLGGLSGAGSWAEYLVFRPTIAKSLRDIAYQGGLEDRSRFHSLPRELADAGPEAGNAWLSGFWLVGQLKSFNSAARHLVVGSLVEEVAPGGSELVMAWAARAARLEGFDGADVCCFLSRCNFCFGRFKSK